MHFKKKEVSQKSNLYSKKLERSNNKKQMNEIKHTFKKQKKKQPCESFFFP